MRVLMWLLLGFLVYLALRKKTQGKQNMTPFADATADGTNASTPRAAPHVIEDMVGCARCQLFVPASEAVVRGELSYCCVAHADQVP